MRDYDRLRLDLASLIQSAFRLIDQKSNPEAHQQCRDLLTSLAEDRFTLAVVGQFNRGKSSLMNAVLGLNRLPVGIVPLTSVITKVSYGNPERVLLEFRGSSLKDEISLDRLPEYVTEEGNPGNQKQIKAAEVQLSSDFLRRGLFFVDTPGIGSAIEANTATTEQFLPQADAVIFVTSFDSPLGQAELEFLQKVREHVRKIFLIVNKSDLVTAEQREQVLGFIRQRLENEAGLRKPRLFAVSALIGLEAKLSGSIERLKESGLPTLEESLVQFLTNDKTREFLSRTCDRALSVLGELVRGPGKAEQPGAGQVGRSDESVGMRTGHDVQEIAGEGAVSIEGLSARLMTFRGKVLGDLGGKSQPSTSPRPANRVIPDAELMEAVRKPCQVCVHLADAMLKFMAKFQYKILVNENERTVLARRGGLCPLHTWQYSEIASPQGISSAYPQVLKDVSRRLSDLARSEAVRSLNDRSKGLVARPETCRACQEQATVEKRVLNEIFDGIHAPSDQEPARFPVLCIAHLGALLRKLPDETLARDLLEFEAALFERLAENMERYALKHDALRRYLNSDDDRVAYHRGLSQLVGDKRLQAPWRVERLV